MTKALSAVNDFVVKFANVNGSGSASAMGKTRKSPMSPSSTKSPLEAHMAVIGLTMARSPRASPAMRPM